MARTTPLVSTIRLATVESTRVWYEEVGWDPNGITREAAIAFLAKEEWPSGQTCYEVTTHAYDEKRMTALLGVDDDLPMGLLAFVGTVEGERGKLGPDPSSWGWHLSMTGGAHQFIRLLGPTR